MNDSERRFAAIRQNLLNAAATFRQQNAQAPFLCGIKQHLNAIFSPANNQIFNLDAEAALQRAMHQLHAASFPVSTLTSAQLDAIERAAMEHLVYNVIIRFENVTIKNSADEEHVIRDLFVKFCITPQGCMYHVIYGLRTTGTLSELHSGYVHSHLPSINWDQMFFQPFCLGLRGPLPELTRSLQSGFDELDFQMFCYNLQQYVQWESLEGVPHIPMCEVDESQMGIRPIAPVASTESVYHQILGHFRNMTPDQLAPIMKSCISDDLTVKPSEALEDLITSLLESNRELVSHPNTWAYRAPDGQYYHFDEIPSDAPQVDTSRTILHFKNIDWHLKIIDYDYVDKRKKLPNPNFTQAICKNLTAKLQFSVAARNRDQTEHPYSYPGQGAAADQVSLSQYQPGRMERNIVLQD